MNIQIPNKRKKIHNRTVHCEGFLREDGLWDIEGHLRDTKTYSFKSDHRGDVKAGTAIHDMTIRLTLDDNLNIIDVMTDELLIKEKFSLKHTIKEGDHYIKFLPLKSDIENNVFLLVIHDGKIKEISFMNDFEQSVIMKFENFKKNVRILDSSFKINIPKNFDVIVDK